MKFECMKQPASFYVSGLSHCFVMYLSELLDNMLLIPVDRMGEEYGSPLQ